MLLADLKGDVRRDFELTLGKPFPPLSCGHLRAKRFTVGSDFTGLNAPVLALRMLGLGPMFTEKFVSDNYPPCQRMLQEHFPEVQVFYGDVKNREVESMPQVDVYITSFPCQPFSRAGRQNGRADPRGKLVDRSLEYIKRKLPLALVLENVSALFLTFRPEYNDIIEALEEAGYRVLNKESPLFNAKAHGIPQNCNRMIVLAVLAKECDESAFELPGPLQGFVKLRALIKGDHENAGKLPSQGTPHRDRVKAAYAKAKKKGYNLKEDVVVTDIAASHQFQTSMVNCMPCVTASRGASRGFHVSTTNELMDIDLMERTLAFPLGFFDYEKAHVSARQYGHMLGNSIAINVLMRVFPPLLQAAGIITHSGPDYWHTVIEDFSGKGLVETLLVLYRIVGRTVFRSSSVEGALF